MKFKIYEYNVTPNVNEKNEFSVLLVNDTLTMNGNNIDDENKKNTIKKVLEENKENIITLATGNFENYKGGRQKLLTVKFEDDGEIYKIIGNTPSQEMADFYTRLVTEITNIIK